MSSTTSSSNGSTARAPGALAERRGAPLAVGHERGCEKRQLGAVDGEERLGHAVRERHDRRGLAERAEQRRQHGGMGEGRVDGADRSEPPRAGPRRRARRRARPAARGRARGRARSAPTAAAAGNSCSGAQTTITGGSATRASRPAARRASVEPCQGRLALSRPMRCERPPASRIPATPSIRGLLSPHARHGPAGRRRP